MKRIALLFASFVILISTLVYADQEKIQRGISWLGGQQTAEGAFYSAGGFADALQVTSESVSVLDKSQDAVFDKAAASAFVDQDRQSHTEALYWKIRIKSLSQQSVTSEFAALKANQNFDGGFGSYQGYDSNALDSAFALKAALIAEPSNSALISNVLGYLLQNYLARQLRPL